MTTADIWTGHMTLLKRKKELKLNLYKYYQLEMKSYDPDQFGQICNQWVDRV